MIGHAPVMYDLTIRIKKLRIRNIHINKSLLIPTGVPVIEKIRLRVNKVLISYK